MGRWGRKGQTQMSAVVFALLVAVIWATTAALLWGDL
jgi:hypothetical protein